MGGTPDSVAYSTQKYCLFFPRWYRTPLQGSPAVRQGYLILVPDEEGHSGAKFLV